jgi:hypothetical protein
MRRNVCRRELIESTHDHAGDFATDLESIRAFEVAKTRGSCIEQLNITVVGF